MICSWSSIATLYYIWGNESDIHRVSSLRRSIKNLLCSTISHLSFWVIIDWTSALEYQSLVFHSTSENLIWLKDQFSHCRCERVGSTAYIVAYSFQPSLHLAPTQIYDTNQYPSDCMQKKLFRSLQVYALAQWTTKFSAWNEIIVHAPFMHRYYR